MITLLLALALSVPAPPDGDMVAFENITFQMPAGWTQAELSPHLLLTPGDSTPEQSFVVLVSHESNQPAGTLAEEFEQAWQEFAALGYAVSDRSPATEIKSTAGATGLASSGTIEMRGKRRFTIMVVFKLRDHYRAITSVAMNETTDKKYRSAFEGLLNSLELKKNHVVASNSKSPNYELLLYVARGLSASPFGGSDIGVSTYVYCVFADGSWLETAPLMGLNGYDLAAEQRKHSEDSAVFGTWQRSNNVLMLRTKYHFETLFPQPDGSYLRKDKEARDTTYFRIPTSTGLRFAGQYFEEGQSDEPSTPSITFRADGTFEDQGVVMMIVPAEVGVRYRNLEEVLGPGSGTYQIVNNTMTLSYADGRRKPILFILTPELAKKKDPGMMYLGNVWFKKR